MKNYINSNEYLTLMQPNSYKRKGKKICDPTGWYMSEKLDGMKGRWIGGRLMTRSNLIINAPEWFIDLLPNVDIEGEFYFGQNSFHRTGSLRRTRSGKAWKTVCFYVFDIIDYELTWIERQKKLKIISESFDGEKIQMVVWKRVKSPKHAEKYFNKIIKNEGEGIILADPWGIYEDGHVNHMLKYKALKNAEAIVYDYRIDSSGKRLASFYVYAIEYVRGKPKVNKKISFNIGTGLKIKQRFNYKEKYPIGTVITYSYELMGKNKKPRTPIFKGIRADVNCSL